MWFAPDGSKLAYVRFNDSMVSQLYAIINISVSLLMIILANVSHPSQHSIISRLKKLNYRVTSSQAMILLTLITNQLSTQNLERLIQRSSYM